MGFSQCVTNTSFRFKKWEEKFDDFPTKKKKKKNGGTVGIVAERVVSALNFTVSLSVRNRYVFVLLFWRGLYVLFKFKCFIKLRTEFRKM